MILDYSDYITFKGEDGIKNGIFKENNKNLYRFIDMINLNKIREKEHWRKFITIKEQISEF